MKWRDCSQIRIIRVTSSKERRNVLAEVRIHRWLAASYMEYRVLFESSARMSRKRRCRRGTSPFKAYTEADKRFDIVYKAPNTTSGLLVDASKGLPPVSSAFYAAIPCLVRKNYSKDHFHARLVQENRSFSNGYSLSVECL